MADIHDLQAAAEATSIVLGRLDPIQDQLAEEGSTFEYGLLVALEGIAFAIRELGVRIDYVSRDQRRRT